MSLLLFLLSLGVGAPSASISSAMFFVVLTAATLHAVWNFLAKRTKGHVGVMVSGGEKRAPLHQHGGNHKHRQTERGCQFSSRQFVESVWRQMADRAPLLSPVV